MAKTKCKSCKKTQPREEGIIINMSFFCDRNCAIDYAIDKSNKARVIKSNKARVKEKKELKRNNRTYQFNLTKSVIQKWVNHVRDKGKPCISCETTNNIVYAGGHYKTAGGHSEKALNSLNIFRQCNFHCNSALSGNLYGDKNSRGMITGIINDYSQNRLDYLDSNKSNRSFTNDELIEMRAYYNYLIRNNISDDCMRVY